MTTPPPFPAIDRIEAQLVEVVARVTGLPRKMIAPDQPMERYGISSAMIVELARALAPDFPDVSTNLFFEFRTVRELAAHLAESDTGASVAPAAVATPDLHGVTSAPVPVPVQAQAVDDAWLADWLAEVPAHTPEAEEIAVVGMAGRYPDAPDLDAFWQNLCAGRDSVTEVPEARWNAAQWFDPDTERADRVYSKWGGFLDGIDRFDARFFNISPREAKRMDPQERLFLETAYTCLEGAGYSRTALAGSRTGVFVGAMWSLYQLYGAESTARGEPDVASSSFASIANRLSWFLDLRGPSLAIDTMCSSSLTAIHLAIQALRNGECDQAVAGGVNLCAHPAKYLHLSRGGFAARDGRCRAFGEGGSGYVPGEGVGVVLLKPLSRAKADGDDILAVIKGCALNHGGRTNGYTVPSPQGQSGCLATALADAAIDPARVVYVEAHGTGTSLGDPIEVEGILRSYGERPEKLRIGSVKSNIGHLEAAAGMAGLHKLILQMRHGMLVPSLHSDRLNPNIRWDRLNVGVQQRLEPLAFSEGDAMALSAFGAGGSNAHLILAKPPADKAVASGEEHSEEHVFLFSASTGEGLRQHLADMRNWLSGPGRGVSLARIAHQLACGRDALAERQAVSARDHDGLARAIDRVLAGDAPAEPLPAAYAEWQAGAAVATERLWPGRPQTRLSLPVRPFARESFWLADPLGPQGVVNAVPVSESAEAAAPQTSVFEGIWQEVTAFAQPGSAGQTGPRPDAILCSTNSRQAALAAAAAFTGPEIPVLDIADPLLTGHLAAASAVLDLTIAEQGTDSLRGRHGWLIDRLASRKPLSCLRIGSGQKGLLDAELLRLLPAEAPHLTAASVETDRLDAALVQRLWTCFTSDMLAPAALHRLTGDRLEQLEYRQAGILSGSAGLDPARWHVITGGTGGIGLQLAAHLVARGARRLVLAGTNPVPPRADWPALIAAPQTDKPLREKLSALSALPDDTRIVQWNLACETALRTGLQSLANDGGIGLVVHLAGSVDRRPTAFADKEDAAIRSVLSAKFDGAGLLARILPELGAERLLLASSQCAAMPTLAAGVLDYAVANAGLNRIALMDYHGLRVQSLMLPNWLGAGFGKSASPQLARLGLRAVRHSQGLALIDAALASDAALLLSAGHEAGFTLAPALRLAGRKPVAENQPKASAEAPQSATGQREALIRRMAEAFAPVLDLDPARWGSAEPFAKLGVDSVMLTRLATRLEKIVSAPVPADVLIEHDTLQSLAAWVAETHPGCLSGDTPGTRAEAAPQDVPDRQVQVPSPAQAATQPARQAQTDRGIAIVGIGTVVPGADTAEAFWQNLLHGKDHIREVPPSRWPVEEFFGDSGPAGTTSKWGGFVEGVEQFTPEAFGLPPAMGEATDPLVRLALWATRGALCDAGLAENDLRGQDVGVFLGSRVANWADRLPKFHRESVLGTAQNFIAAHVAHWLDLRGPAVVVDTACSSSLYSVHMACNSLLMDECSMALAGGSECLLDERPYQVLGKTGAMSPTGRCRTFDAAADGFVPGEGAVVLVLKRLRNALIDGDRILAVIESSAVNNDGRTMGVTTPNPAQQRAVIRRALELAGVHPSEVGYIEAHGTGTALGDPMELKGLTEVFREGDTPGQPSVQHCGIGSVKTNIGHLLSSAGAASIAKVALSLRNAILPPTLNCADPNPRFSFEQSPFYPVLAARPFAAVGGLRRAGINGFGFGGTNVHLQLSDRHRTLAYAPARASLPVPSREGPLMWHPRPAPRAAMPETAAKLQLAIRQDASASTHPDTPSHSVTEAGFRLLRRA